MDPAEPSVRGTIPFDYIDHLFVRVTLNDSLDALLVYDPVQGVLLDERFARRHGLSTLGGEEAGYGGPVTVGGAGSERHVVRFVRDLTLQADTTLERTFPLAPVIPLDSMMAGALGRPVDGLFGIDLLADYVLEIDFEGERFVLHDSMAFVPPPDAVALPIRWLERGAKPLVPITLHLPNGEAITGQVIVDFGMGGALRLTTAFTNTHRLHERFTPTITSGDQQGLGGALQSLYARAPSLSLGSLRVDQLIFSMARETRGADSGGEHDGLIGLGLLDRYRVFYDVPGERLWLAPTPRTTQPFFYVTTGVQWDPLHPTEATGLIVSGTRPGSPSADADLRPGDQLVAVNGHDASTWTKRDWEDAVDRAALEVEIGATRIPLDLQILRDGVPRTIRLYATPQL